MTEEEIKNQLLDIEVQLKEKKNSAQLLNDAGVGYYLLGKYSTSKKYLVKAVRQEKKATYLFNLANTCSQLNDIDQAIDLYLQVLEIEPAHKGSLNNLADEYERKGNFDKAHELFDYLANLHPNDALSHFNLGNFFLRQNMHIEATRCYEIVLKKDPLFADAYHNIAWILYQAKAYIKCIEYAENGLKIDPNHHDLSTLRSSAKKKL